MQDNKDFSSTNDNCSNVENISMSGLTHIQKQPSSLSNKILTECDEFYEELLNKQAVIISGAKERHEDDVKELTDEIERLTQENSIKIRVLENELKERDIKIILNKYFFKWRLYTQEKNRQKHLLRIATYFYEKQLMKKMFSQWLQVSRQNWKKKLELKIIMENYTNQKSIVEDYEKKLQKLSENASETQSQLKSLHSSFKDTLQKAYLQGLNFNKKNTNTSYFIDHSNREDEYATALNCSNQEEESPKITHHRNREERIVDLTEYYEECDCASYATAHVGQSSPFTYSDTVPINYKYVKDPGRKSANKKHTSALPKCLPIMGTPTQNAQQKLTTLTLCPDSRQTIIVEKYIPVAQPNTSNFLFASTSKPKTKKKIV